jgi:hypothetical protein
MHHDVTLHLNEKTPNGTDRKFTVAFNISKEFYTNTKISKEDKFLGEDVLDKLIVK